VLSVGASALFLCIVREMVVSELAVVGSLYKTESVGGEYVEYSSDPSMKSGNSKNRRVCSYFSCCLPSQVKFFDN